MILDRNNKKLSFKVEHYSDRAYYFIKDSLDKMNIPEKDLKNVRNKIRKFYNTKNNSLPIELNYNYTLEGDTLILIGENKIKYLNITNDYKN